MKAYSNEKLNMDRLRAMDRALMASRLVQPQFYEKTEKAIKGPKGPNKELFLDVCKDAQITDTELIEPHVGYSGCREKSLYGPSPWSNLVSLKH
jgi:hypothetical protein